MKRAPSRPPELPGYEYVRALGSGGFSDVFLYEQKLPRRNVAVKVLLTDELNPATRQSFVAEANVMAQLSAHPSIVTIFHADVAADLRPYFVMEYCAGPSLAERYKRERFTVEDTLRIGIRLAGAVATAHSAGILHRDIKPANVLTNDYGWPALTDFGISSTLEDELPAHTTTIVRGGATASTGSSQSAIGLSVPWSPPEMFGDEPVPDVRSDEFSLAATLHTLLTGRSPFEVAGRSNGALDLIARIERGQVSPVERDDVSESLRAVLARGMAMRREHRYATVLEFARALQRVEIEMGYAPTPIEMPKLVVASEPGGIDDADATKARNITTLAAQTPAQLQPFNPPESVQPTDQAVRPVGAPRFEAPLRSTPHAADGTVIRSSATPASETANAASSGKPVDPNEVVGEPIASPARKRSTIIVLGVAGALIAGTVGAAVLFGGIGATTTPPLDATETSAAPGVGAGDTAVVSEIVPTPILASVASAPDGNGVVFTMENPEPQEGDSFRWSRSDDDAQMNLSTTPEIAVAGVTAGEKVCIDVSVQRTTGKLSAEPARVCNQ